MPFQILSLSGGGYLGLYTAAVLAELEREVERPIATCFDLIAGTSVGGLIALGLAAEVPARDIKQAFEEYGTSIFSNRRAARSVYAFFDLVRSALSPKYGARALRDTATCLLGDKRLGDLEHPVIIPAVNLSKGKPQVFKTPHHSDFRRDHLLLAVDVALATSAAPTYFPVAQVGDSLFADGGLYANSPDLLAIHEATHFFNVDLSDVRLLSIGTTTSQFSFGHAGGTELGIVDWAKNQRLFRTMIASQQMSVDYMLTHQLRERYIRIDVNQSPEQERDLGLDVATKDAQRTIRALADATVQEYISRQGVQDTLSHIAPAPEFFHRAGES